MSTRHLSIDIETRSSVSIKNCGSYRYALSNDFKILLFAYRFDSECVNIIDLEQGETLPEELVHALADDTVIKHAFNAAFEWYCLNIAGYRTPIWQWRCTQAHSLYCGYTAGLATAGEALGLPQDKQKLTSGQALIRYFCTPCKPTKNNGGRSWNLPKHSPERWNLFKEYCIQDVVAEGEILRRLNQFPMPDEEVYLWQMDVLMNAAGVRIDRELVEGALHINALSEADLTQSSIELTQISNPNSIPQLLKWLEEHTGEAMPNLQKATVADVLGKSLPDQVRQVLINRQQLGKTSISKYEKMAGAVYTDDRVRGMSQYYGAQTGRWAGRLVQPQNLPRNYLKTLDIARRLVKSKNYKGLKMIYGNVPDTLSQLIRTAFIPSEGNKLVVADFAAIEARVIAWLAGEQWVNEVFATHGRIYEATASQMFGVPIERITKGNPEYELRQKGKVATLALGYQGGVAALIKMKALKMGIPEEELPEIVERWRSANPRIKDLWSSVGLAVVSVMQSAQPVAINNLIFSLEGDLRYGQSFFTVRLPSGRKLYYAKPFLAVNQFGRQALHYYTPKGITSTYGGKLVENIVQAIARDCLVVILRKLYDLGLQVVFHVHDEVVIDAPPEVDVNAICDLMSEPVPWAPGLVLKAAGFECEYYQKD